jgi:hypothetical protein
MTPPGCRVNEAKRGRNLERALRLIRLLRSERAFTLYQLARALGVHNRTVRRDLAVIRRIGGVIEVRPGLEDQCVLYSRLRWRSDSVVGRGDRPLTDDDDSGKAVDGRRAKGLDCGRRV